MLGCKSYYQTATYRTDQGRTTFKVKKRWNPLVLGLAEAILSLKKFTKAESQVTGSGLMVWPSGTILRVQSAWTPRETALWPTFLWTLVLSQSISTNGGSSIPYLINTKDKFIHKNVHNRHETPDLEGHWKLPLSEILFCDNVLSNPNFRSTQPPGIREYLGFLKAPPVPPCIVQHKIPPWHTIQIMCPSILHPLSNTHFLYSLFRCFDKTPRNLIEGKVYLGLTVQKG